VKNAPIFVDHGRVDAAKINQGSSGFIVRQYSSATCDRAARKRILSRKAAKAAKSGQDIFLCALCALGAINFSNFGPLARLRGEPHERLKNHQSKRPTRGGALSFGLTVSQEIK
jgi:hypothetical protein